ncbi:MAG TPA: prolipoprotein diacylglyceryl transferase family protein [Anaerolineae bacterium]|nr:prolipoprotein diacylglyceryl transferase family protein [Anaerolineae bacterium]
MLPVFRLGSVSLPVAPLLIIASFWISLWLIARAGKRFGLNEDVIFNAGFFGAGGGLLGARIWYVIGYWSYYQDRLGEVFALNLGTLAPFEGLITGVLIAAIYLQRKRVPGAAFFDALAPGLAAFTAGLSLANLASGAAFGEPTDLPWGIYLWDARRHPTQIYDLLLSIGIVFATLRVLRSLPPSGRVFGVSLVLLAASRLLTEGFRGDSALLDGGWRSLQLVWLVVLVVGLIGLAWLDTRLASMVETGNGGDARDELPVEVSEQGVEHG